MIQNHVSIAISILRDYVPKDGSLKYRLRETMAKAWHECGWILTADDDYIKAAVGAVMMEAGEGSDDFENLSKELRALGALSAAMSGIPVNMELVEMPEDPVGVLGLWSEAKEAEL